MDAANRQQIVEVGAALVAPPDDVMQFATVVRDRTARDGTAPVQPAQGTTLRPVRQPGRTTQVQFAGCVEHDTVANHHGVHVGVAGQRGEHAGGDLDRDRELADRAHLTGGVGVDHHDELGPSRLRPHRRHWWPRSHPCRRQVRFRGLRRAGVGRWRARRGSAVSRSDHPDTRRAPPHRTGPAPWHRSAPRS